MTDKLEKILSSATEAEVDTLMERFDPEAHMDEQIKDRINARLRQRIKESKRTEKRVLRSPWKKVLAVAAACAAVYLVLGFTMPGVSNALYSVFHPDYRTEAYFSTPPEQRQDPVKDLETSVGEFQAKDVESKVELLGEYTILTRYDAEYNDMANNTPTLRETYGFSPYRREDYAYLNELSASVRELYYDGERLFVTAFVATEHPEWFLREGETTPPNLELSTFDFQLTVNGEAFPIKWNVSSGGGSGVTEHDGEKGLWVSTKISLTEALPDAHCELLMLYYVYDCDVDDMGAIGNVGRLIHRITFESKAGNHHESRSVEATFTGSAPMTLTAVNPVTLEEETIENRTVCFDGLKMRFTVQYLSSGLKITAALSETPQSWTEAEKEAFLYGFLEPLTFEAQSGDERITVKSFEISRQNWNWTFELPVFPSEYAGIGSIVLIPKIRYLSEFDAYVSDSELEGHYEHVVLTPDTGAIPRAEHNGASTIVETPLSDVRIEIPLP
jgi:hypothetical protein